MGPASACNCNAINSSITRFKSWISNIRTDIFFILQFSSNHQFSSINSSFFSFFIFVFMFSCGKGALLSYLDQEKVPFYWGQETFKKKINEKLILIIVISRITLQSILFKWILIFKGKEMLRCVSKFDIRQCCNITSLLLFLGELVLRG